jgi:hypothetical protein
MPYCTNCGSQVLDAEAFCTVCGTPNPNRSEAAPATPGFGQSPPGSRAELRPLGIGEVVDVAIRIYRDHAATLLKIVALVIVPVSVLTALITASAIPDEFANPQIPRQDFEVDPAQPFPFDFGDIGTFFAGIILASALTWIGTLIATGASLKAVADAYLGQTPDAESSLRFALNRVGPLLWLSFLQGLLLVPAFLACIAPGVWLAVSWSVAVPALLLEGNRGWSALSRSFNLVKTRWFPTVAVLLIAFILSAIIQGIFTGIFSFLIPGAGDSFVSSFFSSAIGDAIGTTLTTPFTAAVVAIIYFDLRVRKEGLDVELLAQRVGIEPATPQGGGWGPTPPPSGFGGPPPTGGAFGDAPAGGSGTTPPPEPPPTPEPPPPEPPTPKPKPPPPDPSGPRWEPH